MSEKHYPAWAIESGKVLDKLVADEEQGKIQASQQKDERIKTLLSEVEKKRKIRADIMAAKSSLKDDEVKAAKEKKERAERLEKEIMKAKKDKAIQAEIDKVKASMTPEEKKQMEAALEAKKKKKEEEDKKKKKDVDAAKDKPQGVEPGKAKAAPIEKESKGKELPTDKKLNDPADKKSAGMTAEETADEEAREEHEKAETKEEEEKEEVEAGKNCPQGVEPGKAKAAPIEKEPKGKELPTDKKLNDPADKKSAGMTAEETAKVEAAKQERITKLKEAIKAKRLEGEELKKKIEAAPKLDEKELKKVKPEQITKETTRFQKTGKKPEEVEKEAEEAEPIAEGEKKLFDEVMATINKLTEITNAKQAEMKKVTDAFKDPELATSKAVEQAIENYYNHAKINNKLGDIAKLAEGVFVGVYERIKPTGTKYTKEEQEKIDKVAVEIKALNEKKKELEDLLGKYNDFTREITVLEYEKKPKQTEIKTSINAEDQADMVENAEAIEKGTGILEKMVDVLKDIFKIGKNIDKLAPVAASKIIAMEIKEVKFEDIQKLSREGEEGLVALGCGGDLNEWLEGISTELEKSGSSKSAKPEENFSEAYKLTSTGGRIDLVLVFKKGAPLNMGRMAIWRLEFGDLSWISDFVVNYAKHYGVDSIEEEGEDEEEIESSKKNINFNAKKTESLEKQLKLKKEKLEKLKEEKKDIEKELKEAEALEKELEKMKKK